MDLCIRGIFGLQFGIAFVIVVATFISTIFSSLFTLLIPTLVSRFYEATTDANAILFVTLALLLPLSYFASDFLVLSLITFFEFLDSSSKWNNGWHRYISVTFLILIPFQNFLLRLLSTYCGYVATLWASLTTFELLLSVGLTFALFVFLTLLGRKHYSPLSRRSIAYIAFKIVFHVSLGLITLGHMKLDVDVEANVVGQFSFIFSRIVGSLFVALIYNITASFIHRGQRDKFSAIIASFEVKQKYFTWITTFLTYLIASLNLGHGGKVFFFKLILIFLSSSLFIEATAYFDSYIQAKRSLSFLYANLGCACMLVFGVWASETYFQPKVSVVNSISLNPFCNVTYSLGPHFFDFADSIGLSSWVSWIIDNFSDDSADITESIIILSIRSTLLFMAIIWIFRLWSQFIQFSSAKNIIRIFDPIPVDNNTFYEMSGVKCIYKSAPRWTENASALKAKSLEMQKRPFNEFEQSDNTISIQFVYGCLFGTLGVAVGLYCYGFETWIPLWILAASYLSCFYLLSKRFKPSLLFVILRLPYLHPDYPRLVFLMYFLFTLFVEGLSLSFVLSTQVPLWVSYWVALIWPTLELIEEKSKRKNLFIPEVWKQAFSAILWTLWAGVSYMLCPSNRIPFTSFSFFQQRFKCRQRFLLISWLSIFVLNVIYASSAISWRFCLFVSVTLIGFGVVRILGYISFYYPDDESGKNSADETVTKRSPRNNKEAHRHYTYKCYQIFILIGLFLCVFYILPTPSALSTPYFIPLSGNKDCPLSVNNNLSMPPICEPRWHSMDFLDLSFLAQTSYITSKTELIDTLHTWFPKTCASSADPQNFGPKLLEINQKLSTQSNFLLAYAPDFVLSGGLQPPLSVLFYDFYDTCSNKHFIAIRGSMSLHDWLTDVDLWMESCLYTLTKRLLPLLNYIPETSEALIIKLMATPQLLFSHYFEEHKTYRYLQGVISSGSSRDDIIIIGHSLGGGLAKIVGVNNNVTAISISGPGVLLSRHKFGLSKIGIRDHTVDVVTENDIVPLIDTHGGSLYRITCSHSNLHHECHYLTSVISQLVSLCPDKLARCVTPVEEKFNASNTRNPRDLSILLNGNFILGLFLAITCLVLFVQLRNIMFQSTHFAFDYSPQPRKNQMQPVIDELLHVHKAQALNQEAEPKKSPKRNFDSLTADKKNAEGEFAKKPMPDSIEEESNERKFVAKKLRYETKYDETKQAYGII